MGRPKKNSADISATEKIEKAFWYILEKEGFACVTILRLSQESGLNRNTIYYHYENVEDVAAKAFRHNIDNEAGQRFISAMLADSQSTDREIPLHVKKIHLFAKSESSVLQSIVKETITNTWLDAFHIDKDSLTESDLISLEFIMSGVTGMLGNKQFISSPDSFQGFPNSPIGRASIETLKGMALKR